MASTESISPPTSKEHNSEVQSLSRLVFATRNVGLAISDYTSDLSIRSEHNEARSRQFKPISDDAKKR